MAKTKVKASDVIEWEDGRTNITLQGIVRKVLEKSVIVDIEGTDDATVVSHRRYKIINEGSGEVDATTKPHPLRRTFPRKR